MQSIIVLNRSVAKPVFFVPSNWTKAGRILPLSVFFARVIHLIVRGYFDLSGWLVSV